MKRETYYFEDLKREAEEELEERIKWCRENEEQENSDNLISEVADNNIPIYTYDLLQYASNNFDLIHNDFVGYNPTNVISLIQSNIYELLTKHLYEYLTERKED